MATESTISWKWRCFDTVNAIHKQKTTYFNNNNFSIHVLLWMSEAWPVDVRFPAWIITPVWPCTRAQTYHRSLWTQYGALPKWSLPKSISLRSVTLHEVTLAAEKGLSGLRRTEWINRSTEGRAHHPPPWAETSINEDNNRDLLTLLLCSHSNKWVYGKFIFFHVW